VPAAVQKLVDPAGLDFANSRLVLRGDAGVSAYVVRRGSDELCLLTVEAGSGTGVSCNTTGEFTGSRGFALAISSGDHSPDATAVVIGVAADNVASVAIPTTTGVIQATPNADGGFVARTNVSVLETGDRSISARTSEGQTLPGLQLK
jgi:hypothetical protein